MHVKEHTCTLLIITWYRSRNCTKWILKPLLVKIASLFHSCVLLYSFRLYYFSLHDDYPPFFATCTRSIYIVMLPFLINWNERQRSKSNTLTMDHKLVLESSSSAAVYTLLNTIIYLKVIKYLNIRLRQIYLTDVALRKRV